MKNCIQSSGDNIDVTADTDYVSGDGVLIGSLFGVAAHSAASGAALTIVRTGVFRLAKDPDAVFAAAGARVWWDTANKVARSDSDSDSNGGSDAEIGVTVAAAGAGLTTVDVALGVGVPLL